MSAAASGGRARDARLPRQTRGSWLLLGERGDGGPEFLVDRFRRQRPDALVADDTLAIDEEALRRAIHAKVDGCAAFLIHDHGVVGIAVLGQPGLRVIR